MTIEIFEKHPTADAYKVGAAFTEYCILAKEKRFTEAELAAEFWKMTYDHEYEALMLEEFKSGPDRKAAIRHWIEALSLSRERQAVLNRFAYRPHFDA